TVLIELKQSRVSASSKNKHVTFRVARHADPFAEVKVRGQLQKISHRLIRDVGCGFEGLRASGGILLRERHAGQKQNDNKQKRFFRSVHSSLQEVELICIRSLQGLPYYPSLCTSAPSGIPRSPASP